MNLYIEGYIIEKPIKKGGFGEVYIAKRAKDRKIVAIKMLTPQSNSQIRQRLQFYNEAKILSKLNHPSIIKFYELIKGAPRPAFSMEYFESNTLKSLILNKSPILGEKGIGIFRKVLEGVKYLHENKIIHKDIKPENILVNDEGDVRIIDFTLAEKVSFFSFFKIRTREGTPMYMSPEQIRKKSLDYRTDIFSLGATFYEAFSGRTHISGVSDKHLLQQQLRGIVSKMRSFNKKVPYQLDNIILRMLKKKPEERYQSIAEILFELNKFTTGDRLYKNEKE